MVVCSNKASIISTGGRRGLTSFINIAGSGQGQDAITGWGPLGELETNFILIEGDDTDLGPQRSKLKDIIQEK